MAFRSSSSLWTVYVVVVVVSHCSCGDLQQTACPGQDVSLPCFSPPGNVTVLEWVKPELHTQLYVFFLRQNRLVESFLHPSFRNRTVLSDDGINGNMTVILRNVTVNDTGTYECRVSVDMAKSRKPALQNIISLEVEDVCRRPDSSISFLENTQTRQYLFVGLPVGGFLLVLLIISCFVFYGRRHRSPPTETTERCLDTPPI